MENSGLEVSGVADSGSESSGFQVSGLEDSGFDDIFRELSLTSEEQVSLYFILFH
jgi:hypothetical protein